MTAPVATFLSYRLGGTDGVSVETAKWEWALRELGFATRRVAGELDAMRSDDTWLAFLSIDPPAGADVELDALGAAYAEAGRYDDAREALQRAIALVDREPGNPFGPMLRDHLNLIEGRRPIRTAEW